MIPNASLRSGQHPCSGAECPYCGLFPLRRVTPQAATSFLLAMPRRKHHERLATFRDSTGQSVPRWPDVVIPSTTIIVLRDQQKGSEPSALVHQRKDNGFWGFPGGRQEVGESIKACAIREAKEESGFDVELLHLVSVDSDPEHNSINTYKSHAQIIHYCNLAFLAKIVAGTLRMSHESTALCWAPIHHFPQPFLPAHLWRFRAAQSMIAGGGVLVR